MDVIESIKKDKAYLKCKLIVKNWEKEFKSQHSRTPSKFDIKEAPTKIKYAYKKYFQLKSAFLENSLTVGDLDEDSLGSPDFKPHLENIPDSPNALSGPVLPELPTAHEIHELFTKSKVQNNMDVATPFIENLSKKLFQNRRFSLRNPRKFSLPKSEITIEESKTCLLPEIPNDDKLKDEKLEFCESFTLSSSGSHSNRNTLLSGTILNPLEGTLPVRHINKEWLERVTEEKINKSSGYHEGCEVSHKFGLSNIQLPSFTEKTKDFVENSESEEDNELNKLKPALKKRKITNNKAMCSSQSDKHENSFDNNFENTVSRKIKMSNNTTKKKSKLASVADNSSVNQPPDISEYVPFGIESDINPRHNNVTNVLKNIEATTNSIKNIAPTNEDKLYNKIKSGTLNENFVKINIEKKVFVRGKKNMNYSKYKKQQWKDKKALHAGMEFPEGGKVNCFKCGNTGHMARYCTAHKGDTLMPLDSYDDNDLPTLEDMKNVVSSETNKQSQENVLADSVYSSSTIPESFMQMLAENPSKNENAEIKPIFSTHHQETPKELYDTLKMFGHDSFRPGQEEAIMRILSGMSTLLILSTGGGKSLCYQIPAYIYSQHYKCITIVISPLVSLMEDQVLSMPEFLKAGCLHSNQPPTQRGKVIQCLKDGEINILLISPEALISGDTNGFSKLFKTLPPIAFACIDEAHCVSQWSHNFRPSYLMICRVLREKLKVNCILGLTATASRPTIGSVISHINIPDGLTGVIINPTLPENLCLSVSFEKDKDRALVSYLLSEHISSFNSIIVYCIRRDECERIAAILRSCLQEPNKINMEKQNNKRKRMSFIAESYHAGMSAAQRKKIQNNFMNGTLRIIVATVAFGMGINKSDIRCIIHYNMPSSFESYVQEVGRAGRDGKPACCHVFMNNSNNDRNELLKHIHSNTIDRPIIRRLLQSVFIPCECGTNQNQDSSSSITQNKDRCKGHEVGIPIDSTVETLDLPSENIATLLCYIELHPKNYIKVLNNAYIMCKISSYGGPSKIVEAAKTCAPLAMAYLLESKKDPETMNKTILEFNVIEVASAIGWESGVTKYYLKNLEWTTENGSSRKSQLKVEFNTLGFRIKACGDLASAELDEILDDLHNTVLTQEKARLYQLEEINSAFSKLGNQSIESKNINEELLLQQSNELKFIIRNYFQRMETLPANVTLEPRPLDSERVASDVRSLIASYKDCDFTGRSIARIFQGISSPNYPALVWGRCKFWRSHIHEDFYGLIQVATRQIIQMK